MFWHIQYLLLCWLFCLIFVFSNFTSVIFFSQTWRSTLLKLLLPFFKGDVVFPDLERHVQLPSSVRPGLGLTRNVSIFLKQRKKKSKAFKLFKYRSVYFRGQEKEGSYMKIWSKELMLRTWTQLPNAVPGLCTDWLSLWACFLHCGVMEMLNYIVFGVYSS